MRVIEFKSKIRNNTIRIPKKLQSELSDMEGKYFRVMIFHEDEEELYLKDYQIQNTTLDVANDDIESINMGLKDFEEGKIHSNKTPRKLNQKYL